jgi:hypothetical protein
LFVVGSNGMRLLRGIGERAGVTGGLGIVASVDSGTGEIPAGAKIEPCGTAGRARGLWGLPDGRGDGERGP